MLKRRPKDSLPLQNDPGDTSQEPCGPGSIEQQLDMCEQGNLRGDEVERHVSSRREGTDLVDELESFNVTMDEQDREGDEMSGDDHSSGLQGGEPELENQPHIDSGIPGGSIQDPGLSVRKFRSRKPRLAG